MDKKKRIILVIVCVFILFIVLISLFFIDNRNNDYELDMEIERNDNVNNPIDYNEIIKSLRDHYNNDDVVGILEINNTDYSVPIMQGDDNSYYLDHTPDGEYNQLGSIYLDYRVDIDSSKKLLVYGHNSKNIDMPFNILEEYYDKDYYDSHKYIEITTSTTKKKYEIFSVHVETSDFSYMNIKFKTDKDYLNHIKRLKTRSMYDTLVEVTSSDEILILQTCSEHPYYKNYEDKFLLVIAKRV